MKICVVQTKPIKGDVASNVVAHKKFVDLAVAGGAETVIFPELSVTGYEPTLAHELATTKDDRRFDDFQQIADAKKVTIGIGVPLKDPMGISIGMVVLRPHARRETYSKKYIHRDEEPFFISGQSSIRMIGPQSDIALAICYELSVPQHSADAFESGARIYIASVAKSAQGVEKAIQTLSDIAKAYSMTVLMSNCVGPCDNFEAAGRSSVWNDRGELLGQLSDAAEGFLILDTQTGEVVQKTL